MMRNLRRRYNDGSEFVAAVIVMPLIILFTFGLVSLNYGAFQRQLVEYGAAHAVDHLEPDFATLSQQERDRALMDAICKGSPLLNADWCDLKVTDTRIDYTQTATNSSMLGTDAYGRSSHGAWGGAASGTGVESHTDSWQVRVQATVTYHVPVLLPSAFYRNTQGNDLYVVNLDRSYVIMRREEVM